VRKPLPGTPFLYVLTDRVLGGAPHADLARAALEGGALVVQVRDKELGTPELLAECRSAADACRGQSGLVVVNDRVDLALLAGADGVHLGERDLSPEDARKLAGDTLVVGLSTHGVEEALRASRRPVDYVALGPIYASSTKPGRMALGPEAVRRVKERLGKPLVAIGGIGLARVKEVVEAGADGVAVLSAAMSGRSVREATEALVRALPRR
jgi:thiamine-phosphate pyrophosphorylase